MTAKFICTILLFSFYSPIFSQTSSESGYLALSYSFGITDKILQGNSSNSFSSNGSTSGTISSVELSNIPEENIGYLVNFTSTTYKLDKHQVEYILENHILQNYALTFGARFYANHKRVFFDLGTGYYNIESFRGYNIIGGVGIDRYFTDGPGFNFGIGTRILLGNTTALVLKSKANLVASSEGLFELNFNSGLEFNNSKQILYSLYPGSFSTGLILGNSGKPNNKFVGSYGAEFTCAVSNDVSFVANYLHKSLDRNYFDPFIFMESWENNYAGGIRNSFGKNRLKPFLECLANINVRSEKSDNQFDGPMTLIKKSIGLVIGTGAEFDLSDRVTGILKGNYTFFDNVNNVAGMFGGLKYRF